jgi:regulator of sirC expression with transglutaminase-like and TPR domain
MPRAGIAAYTVIDMPTYSLPTPLEYFASLVADDEHFALTEAAVAIAQDEEPRLDVQSVLSQIDVLAQRLRQRLPADAGAVQKLRLLNGYFYRELGFSGNVNDYYAPRNSYLHEVLRTRQGIPISLAVIYLEIAQQVGLAARGVSFPGHFLIKLKMPQGEVVLDPFTGKSLSREQLDERLVPYKRRQGLQGEFDIPLGLFLQAAAPREVIARMLRNLKELHRSQEDWSRLVPVQQRLVVLLPADATERRDLGLARAEMGDAAGAATDLEAYLRQSPSADDRDEIAGRVAELRAAGPRHLH